MLSKSCLCVSVAVHRINPRANAIVGKVGLRALLRGLAAAQRDRAMVCPVSVQLSVLCAKAQISPQSFHGDHPGLANEPVRSSTARLMRRERPVGRRGARGRAPRGEEARCAGAAIAPVPKSPRTFLGRPVH